MEAKHTYLSYEETGYYSKIVIDYLQQHPQLQPFYQDAPTREGLAEAMAERRKFAGHRDTLVAALHQQYASLEVAPALANNINALLSNDTFTITTAHQPNIFTGPLYFIYKILHTIKLAEFCTKEFPGARFVPVYYMGSEDADLDELGSITLDGKKYNWQTKQTGAVGRMKVDKAFLALVTEMEGQLGILPHAAEIIGLFKQYYTAGTTIQQATLGLVNALFGTYGLVVLVPDEPALKAVFKPVIKRELLEGFSHKEVAVTVAELEKNYKVQAAGRELNLFYLINDRRERIERNGDHFEVVGLNLRFTAEEILAELDHHPGRFSPNVILRGVFQETVLPGIAFIGGGGELAYWLELKRVFAAAGVPYPVLVLRNSFLLVNGKWQEQLQKLGITAAEAFQPEHELMNTIVQQHGTQKIGLNGELGKVKELYRQISETAGAVDVSLQQHVAALQTRAVQKLEELEKKMLRAEKRKHSTTQRQLSHLKAALFPNDNLQERVENMAGVYALYGQALLNMLLQQSPALEQEFVILFI
ncbi:bacillithiol biosynthesis cysteine-adding enzyme BshC [Deminuibacter soli]|uniref:Putative cysteine ligase BshC n=1 Tax=Deminuibacter soli TaxID=2291815 RepID=A0A3E1NLW4_9BACT|nr:bacillithiol biosynthesis cysteine-adding enzyme BshC [Deminuibacter soli]RFM28925.1 bacillithiol biosynthesis cysteine-adding enzyme BshC [Deminuibacter soli]